jgi:guanylate kinase
LHAALGTIVTVEKARVTYETECAIIHLDDLMSLGRFMEIEVLAEEAGSMERAAAIAEELRELFEVAPMHIVPFSYADLVVMKNVSLLWRKRLENAKRAGRLFLLDGCSCSGKTTLSQRLLDENDIDLTLVPRYCTRTKRGDEAEYVFVNRRRFEELAAKGSFIEFRDFEFGMSYGLPWKEAMDLVTNGRNALGIMNLGNILHVKAIFPEAITILIKAPIETIRRRLHSRGYNTEEQIAERLASAETVYGQESHYDHVIENDDGMFETALMGLRDIVLQASFT